MTFFKTVQEDLAKQGVSLLQAPGEYQVKHKHGHEKFITDDLHQAIAHGHAIAQNPPTTPEPPLGPVGNSRSQRALVRRQNRKVARMRAKRTAGQK